MSEEQLLDDIVLMDEDGNKVVFYVDDQFEFENQTYLVLYTEENEDDSYLYRLDEDEDGEMVVTSVDDDEEFERVSEYYEGE